MLCPTKRDEEVTGNMPQEKSSNEEILESNRKRLSDQHDQLQNLNKSMSLNLSAKKEYSKLQESGRSEREGKALK